MSDDPRSQAPTGAGASGLPELETVAALYGIEPVHRDGLEREVRPSPETLVAVLQALGAPLDDVARAGEVLRARRATIADRFVPPVHVAWVGRGGAVPVPPRASVGGRVELRVRLEDGTEREWGERIRGPGDDGRVAPPRPFSAATPAAGPWIPLPADLPPGRHRLTVACEGEEGDTLLVAAPVQAYQGDEGTSRRWGPFFPVHALRRKGSWGVGDLSALEEVLAWVGRRGGSVVGTLPLFSAFLDGPVEPSPYAPVSRLFWNELYLDPHRLPEWERCPEARELVASSRFRKAVEDLEGGELVDYESAAALRHEVLLHLARTWQDEGGVEGAELQDFSEVRPEVRVYASFRAAVAQLGLPGPRWDESWREGGIPPEASDEEQRILHLYVQLRMAGRVREVADSGRRHGAGLYLDLPLGSHSRGFDVWANPGLFAEDVSLGAPPDAFNPEGQSWGLPPLIPEASRLEKHDHLLKVLTGLMEPSDLLRIDHVMGLHRQYWVPKGRTAEEGVYVRYPAEELYALLSLESHRRETVLVGEDLGTVPPEVRSAMDQVGLRRSYVVPFQVRTDTDPPELAPVPDGAVASLNTHDLPTFAGFWGGGDPDTPDSPPVSGEGEARPSEAGGDPGPSDRGAEDALPPEPGSEEEWKEVCRRAMRSAAGMAPDGSEDDLRALLVGLLRWLGRSRAGLVLVNGEDLWLETRPQNRPGTTHPENWRGRVRHSLAEIVDDPYVTEALDALHRARGGEPR